jgi:hypothetical protein
MSDDPTVPPDVPTDPIPKIMEFFKERGASHTCPICHTDAWMLLDTPQYATMVPLKSPVPSFGLQGWGLYTFVCRNCGFIRSHLRGHLDGTIDLRALPMETTHQVEPEGDNQT